MIEFNDNADAVARAIASKPAAALAALRRSMAQAGAFHQRTVATERFGPYRGSAYPDKLQTRGGGLKRSVGYEVRGDEVVMFAGKPSRIQEYGGDVRAKNRKFLTIPLRAALTAAGRLKGGARIVRSGDRWTTADGWATFILRAKSGKIFIARRRGKTGLELLYKLQESVRIPPRFGFREHFQKRTVPFLLEHARAGIAKAVSS